jgi:hypothetical protein
MGSTARNIIDISSGGPFTYDANAAVLEATITQPLQQELPGQASSTLGENGGYLNTVAKPYQLKNILSYSGGYSQVSGFQDANGDNVTLATAVIEGLNILEILTADRVVAQITSVMAQGDKVQSVSFVGSRFENLRIADQPVVVSVNPDALGAKPADGGSYFDPGNVPAGMTVSGNTLSGTILTATSVPQIIVPNFGTVSLGQLTVARTEGKNGWVYDYKVVMIEADLNGGGVQGNVVIAMADPNGGGGGGGGSSI